MVNHMRKKTILFTITTGGKNHLRRNLTKEANRLSARDEKTPIKEMVENTNKFVDWKHRYC